MPWAGSTPTTSPTARTCTCRCAPGRRGTGWSTSRRPSCCTTTTSPATRAKFYLLERNRLMNLMLLPERRTRRLRGPARAGRRGRRPARGRARRLGPGQGRRLAVAGDPSPVAGGAAAGHPGRAHGPRPRAGAAASRAARPASRARARGPGAREPGAGAVLELGGAATVRSLRVGPDDPPARPRVGRAGRGRRDGGRPGLPLGPRARPIPGTTCRARWPSRRPRGGPRA